MSGADVSNHQSIKGRGAAGNPENRFHPLTVLRDEDWDPAQDPAPATQFFHDASRSIIAYNDSPDVGFSASVNPYRGCEHGCIYCYARPTHEYFDLSAGLDFETKIMVKDQAPQLLRRELASEKWKPQTLTLSGVTDPYQPIERKLMLTRRCLEVLAEFRNPVVIITKNATVQRDADLLGELAKFQAAAVMVSVTTLEADLAAKMEPRTAAPRRRLETIKALVAAGVPAGVMVAPVIPGLTDHEMPAILAAAAAAGARFAGFTAVRLPGAVAPLFADWLGRHFPDRKEKVLARIRDIRGGKLNDPNFHSRMKGQGVFADGMHDMFKLACRRAGVDGSFPKLSVAAFRRPGQMELFSGS